MTINWIEIKLKFSDPVILQSRYVRHTEEMLKVIDILKTSTWAEDVIVGTVLLSLFFKIPTVHNKEIIVCYDQDKEKFNIYIYKFLENLVIDEQYNELGEVVDTVKKLLTKLKNDNFSLSVN